MSNENLPEIEVIYEDTDCAVINKPAGLMVHPDGRSKGPFLTDWLAKRFPESVSIGEPGNGPDGQPLARGGIVHRLDRDTSGALIVAKTQRGFDSLKSQFQDREVKKRYLAFVWGDMKEEFGTIDRPIGRSGSDFRKWSAQRGARGEMREAETYWALLKNAEVPEGKIALVRCEPKTGRTHQIRVHMNAINHPVIGDSLYAPKRPLILGFERLALHALELEFADLAGKTVKAAAPLPADFKKALEILNISKPYDKLLSL
ncbi:MAG: RluA family pseudouridine synthase [Patescibacteria group bacterium]|nr:RluA family pseudouridine synthase [Patescibacteria group bacterium]MDE1940515.1 RluA family pseudouridine synthase [Patescibacteria group bacterium]MDE1966588.1 RluA family pseudouridine synthase [Patescibacteria group bacterium]